MTQSNSAFPVEGGAVPRVVEGIASLQVGADGVARSTPIPGTDKTVYPNIGTTGAVLFALPPTAGLTTTAIGSLTTTQIAALRSNLVLSDLNVTALTTTAINSLTPALAYDAAVALTTTQLQALATSTIATLTTTQISALTAAQAIGGVPATMAAATHPDLPVSTMLSVVAPSGMTVAAATRKANGADS